MLTAAVFVSYACECIQGKTPERNCVVVADLKMIDVTTMYQTFRELVPFLHHAKGYEAHQFRHCIIFFDGGNRHAIGLHDGDGRHDQETP